jgi:hypothetical protein
VLEELRREAEVLLVVLERRRFFQIPPTLRQEAVVVAWQ